MLILYYQVEVNQPVVRTVGNISTAIVQSEFGTSVQRGVQVSISFLYLLLYIIKGATLNSIKSFLNEY